MESKFSFVRICSLHMILIPVLFTLVRFSEAVPCENVVHVDSTELFSYLGNITFSAPTSSKGQWKLAMKTDVPFAFLGTWHAIVVEDPLNASAEFYSIGNVKIEAGQKISIRFRVSWNPRQPVPKVQQLIWQNQRICLSSIEETVQDHHANAIRKQ